MGTRSCPKPDITHLKASSIAWGFGLAQAKPHPEPNVYQEIMINVNIAHILPISLYLEDETLAVSYTHLTLPTKA
jgi:hypothetical protein